MPITRVPRTPDFVRGVINLRGRVIPVVDLRVKFGVSTAEDTERTCIVVVQVQGKSARRRHGRRRRRGLRGDRHRRRSAIEETPKFGADLDTEFVLGIAKVADKVVMLLDIDRVLSSSEAEGSGAHRQEGVALRERR